MMNERTVERMQQMVQFMRERTFEFVDSLNRADSASAALALARRYAEETASWHAVMEYMTEPGTLLWPDAYTALAMNGETRDGHLFGVRWHAGKWGLHS